jgi:hypothetical protein
VACPLFLNPGRTVFGRFSSFCLWVHRVNSTLDMRVTGQYHAVKDVTERYRNIVLKG